MKPAVTDHDTTRVYDGLDGLDEYNLAELPIFDISARGSSPKTTLTYSASLKSEPDKTLQLDCAAGVPTVQDAEVLFALLLIAKQNAGELVTMQHRMIYFSKTQILNLLGWNESGASYKRLCGSLDRWMKTSFLFDNWKCHRSGSYRQAHCNIISSHSVLPSKSKKGQNTLPFCHVNFTEEFWQLLQGENLFEFNFHLFRTLSNGAAKQAYRLLSKRLMGRKSVSFDLHNFACGHLGYASTKHNTPSRLKKRLTLVIAELVRVGLIESLEDDKRYTKIGHGKYEIHFTKASDVGEQIALPSDPDLVVRMLNFNVSRSFAWDAYSNPDIPNERIDIQIQHLEHLLRKEDHSIRNTGSWLRRAIENNHPLPEDFESRQDFELRMKRHREAERKREERIKKREDATKARELEEEKKREAERAFRKKKWALASAHLNGLSEPKREALIDDAFERSAGSFSLKYAKKFRDDPIENDGYEGMFRDLLTDYLVRQGLIDIATLR